MKCSETEHTTYSGKGGEDVIDIELLKEKIEDSGMTMTAIANKSGILRQTLYNRLADADGFKVSEVEPLIKTLHLSEKERNNIFFAKEVQ